MKRIISVIILCLSVLTISAQPQRSGFRQLLMLGETPISMRTLTPLLTLNPRIGFTPEEVQQYTRERMLDDMRLVFLPYYRPHLSYDDINFVVAVLHSPDVRQALRRMEVLRDMNSPERTQYLAPAFGKIMANETPDPVKLKDGINKEYLDACTAYYMATGQGDQLAQGKNSNTLQTANDEGAKHINAIIDYIIAYNPVVMANMAFGKVTIDDFKLITALYETKGFQHLKAGNQALSADSPTVIGKLIEMAEQWKKNLEQ